MSRIADRIVAAVAPICPIHADGAETGRTPYAVYTIDEEPLYDKDGRCGTAADVEVAICASSFDAADELGDRISAAIDALRAEVGIKALGRQPYESPEAKLYVVQLTYTVKEV